MQEAGLSAEEISRQLGEEEFKVRNIMNCFDFVIQDDWESLEELIDTSDIPRKALDYAEDHFCDQIPPYIWTLYNNMHAKISEDNSSPRSEKTVENQEIIISLLKELISKVDLILEQQQITDNTIKNVGKNIIDDADMNRAHSIDNRTANFNAQNAIIKKIG